jgi:hypothetical protein
MDSLGIQNLYNMLSGSQNTSMQQGTMFKNQQRNQYTNALSKIKSASFQPNNLGFNNSNQGRKTVVEGFSSGSSKPDIPVKTQNEISALFDLEKLKATYDGLIQQYQSAQSALSTKTDVYISATTADNIYAGKNVLLESSGALGYVTPKGVYKWYSSWDIADATSGKNGCPVLRNGVTSDYMTLDVENADKYNVVGTVLSKNPRIVVGDPMVAGQSCGNENVNVYVSGSVAPNTTYSGCFKDASDRTMTMQEDGYVFDYESCKQRAVDTGSQYFAIQDYKTDLKLGQCFVSNDYDKAISLGSADLYTETPLWYSDNKTASDHMNFSNDGNLYMMDSTGKSILTSFNTTNGGLVGNSLTGTPDCALTVPTNISATWGGNADGVADGNSTSYLQEYNNGTQTFSYVVGKGQRDTAVGTKKTFDLSYQCGDKIKTQHINGESVNQTVVLDCTDVPTPCTCYLILLDGGLMRIYKGSSPGTNDTLIYAWYYDVSDSTSNPNWDMRLSKTGTNWIPGNTSLYMNEFVVSNDGKLVLYFNTFGNIVLSTFKLVEGCPKNGGEYAYGGPWANSLYSFDTLPNSSYAGKIGYIDDSGKLREYSSDAVKRDKTYKKYSNYDSGDTINTWTNSDPFACKISCGTSDDCSGYVFDNDSKTCYTKDKTVYPSSARVPKPGSDLYIRNLKVNNSNSCSKQIVEIDSDMWNGYQQGPAMGTGDICGLGKVLDDPYDKLKSIQEQIDDTVSQIKDKFSQLQQDNVKLNSDMIQLQLKIGQDLKEYDSVNESIKQKETAETTMNSRLSDSHLVVLQENYKYTFLSIFAIGALVIAINVGKNSSQ